MISKASLHRSSRRHLSTSARSGPPRETPPKPAPTPPPKWRRWLLPVGFVITAALLFAPSLFPKQATSYSFTQFTQQVDAGKVQAVTVNDKGAVTGTLKDGASFTSQVPTALDTQGVLDRMESKNVEVKATRAGTSFLSILLSFLPLLLLVGFFLWTGRQAQRSLAGGLGGIGRSRTKIVDAERPNTRFADVAGYEGAKQEVSEIIDFLRNPERYRQAGAKGPGGVLMVGPPGTGKTLLARAVAGEAEVPFLSVSGSGFVEMFVGVGASRVRDLFSEARKRAPSIIFIDEIDAIGGKRGSGLLGGSHDEREQTLNQLLAEMDGFDPAEGVVVLAATNRPETLDPALLRPGRFDRQVTVPLPAQSERAAILAVHSRGKHLASDVDLSVVARGTPGFSGADLANLVNEAAIHAVRDGRNIITARDLDAARDRIILGRRDATNVLLPEEKQSVAVHESGHALIAALSPHADPVSKITILPAGMALGATQQLPEDERHLYTEGYLYASLAVRLGGRAAELIVFGQGSTGAANDLAGATVLATRMVREFGLSPVLGPVGYSSGNPQYLGSEELVSRPYSEETQRIIDSEVARLLREAEEQAVGLLHAHREALDALTGILLERETVDGSVLDDVLRDHAPASTPDTDGAAVGARGAQPEPAPPPEQAPPRSADLGVAGPPQHTQRKA